MTREVRKEDQRGRLIRLTLGISALRDCMRKPGGELRRAQGFFLRTQEEGESVAAAVADG